MKKGLLFSAVLIGVVGFVVYISRPPTLEERVTGTEDKKAKVLSEADAPVSLQADRLELAVPDFEVQVISGSTVRLSDLVKDKPTVVGFWASWCHNCQRNLPKQNELYSKYKDQINVIEVNMAEKRSVVDRYVSGKNYDFDMAYDEAGVISNLWQVQYTNTHYLIGTDGKVVDAFASDITEDHFKALLKES